MENGSFTDGHDDDYTDHELQGQAIIELNGRNRFDLQAGYIKEHEDRGTGVDDQSGGGVSTPIEYSEFNLQGLYTYGASGAKGNLELNAAYYDREYDNFRTLTEARDRETIRLGATFLYRLAPKSQALFELRHEDIDYQSATSTQDSTEQKYLVGLRWDATAKTSGSAKIGAARKDFDSPATEDFSGASWEVSVRWAPQTYSSFDLTTTQETEESSGTGDYIDTESLTLAWNHEWSGRVSSVASISRIEEDYVGATREDETNSLSLALSYEMRRWLDINFAYTYGERDSNEVGNDYERNQWMITLLGSL
ncbi:outer membrane beta-barrel protein [Marinobacterium jannaschii]|uniref:outer membrane beta-barrel protein n=1 Tax=Marinobacterium jannaschii TaxID=64970 RepID=UPI000A018FF3|nr:outer membrane beta-barrel protein [Marinobacterium jannaschii]